MFMVIQFSQYDMVILKVDLSTSFTFPTKKISFLTVFWKRIQEKFGAVSNNLMMKIWMLKFSTGTFIHKAINLLQSFFMKEIFHWSEFSLFSFHYYFIISSYKWIEWQNRNNSITVIFHQKMDDINFFGHIIWLFRSYK